MARIETKRARLLLLAALTVGPLALCLPMFDDTAPPDAVPPLAMRAVEHKAPAAAAADHERAPAVAAEALGFFGAPVGLVMLHDWSADSTMQLASEQGNASSLRVELSGRMTITVLARNETELIAEVAFPVVEGVLSTTQNRVPVARDSALSLDLAQATFVRMRHDGETVGYRFADRVTADHRNLVRGLCTALRFLPRDEATWRATEQDLLGTANVEYRWLHAAGDDQRFTGALRKTRVGYADAANGDDPVEGTGEGELHWNRDLGWFERGFWQENTRRKVSEAGLLVTSSLRVQTELVDTDWREGLDTADLWAAAWQPVATEVATDAMAKEVERQRRRLAGTSIDQLIADLSALAQHGEIDAEGGHEKHYDLAWLLRTQPNALARLQQLLPGLDPALAGAALAAIGASELPAGQTLLAELFADANQSPAIRLAAAMSMVQVEKPTADAIQRFVAAVGDDAGFDASTAAGMLALGTLAGRADAASQAHALETLLALEGKAAQNGALGGWLEALGNAGADAALAAAERYRADADASVRLAAVSAVRRVRGDAAWQFAAATLQDSEPAVRGRAIEVLADRAESGAFAALAGALRNDTDARVRATAIDALAGRVSEPAVRRLLQEVAADDADADVRRLAADAVARR